jgi:protein-tyrosine phosphatase
MAEYLLKDALRQRRLASSFDVRSAGIAADGHSPASILAIEAMKKLNQGIKNHVSKKVTQKFLNSAMAIFCLTEQHREFLLSNFKGIEGKCFLVKEFTGARDRDVLDPFFGSLADYERPRDDIDSAMYSILKFLTGGHEA